MTNKTSVKIFYRIDIMNIYSRDELLNKDTYRSN